MRNKSVSSSSASPNYTCGMPFPMRIQPLDSEAYREASIRNEVATATAKPVLKSRLKKLLDGILKNPGAKKLVAGDSSDDELDESITAPSCDDSLDILKILIPCANIAERHLLADTSKIIDKNKTCKRKGDLRKIVTDGLLLLGYDASICISRWEKSPSFPAGEYEYIDVIVDGGERIFVDIDFRSEFEMARPTGGYKSILQSLPHIFVGRSDRLLHIVSIVSEAARQSIKERGMHLPPWRKAEYMRARWLSPHSRITAAAVAQPDATVLKEESLSGDLELIFSKETSSGKDIGAVGSEALSPVENLGEEKKYTWQPPAIERKCCERGTKVVNGLASLLGERLSSCGDERITVFTTNHNRMDSEICRELRECKLFPEVRMNPERCSENFRIKAESCWDSVELEHPATLEELGMDPENKGLISDFLGFVRDKEFHKSMGRSCGDNCLVYNSPGGTERSSVIAAMANYLKFDIYHLDLTNFSSLSELFNMLLSTKNRSVIAIEGLYQCAGMLLHLETDEYAVHLLLNEIDKQSFLRRSNERIIVFTTNHRDQHDAASLRPVGMDIYIHMSSPQPIALPDGAYHNSLLVSNSEKENTREAYDSTKPYSLPNFDATGNKAVKVDSRWGRECWHSMELEQPPTFAELGKDPENEGIISDLLSFIRDKELYKRIGKIWTRGYLLCDSPGTNRWSLIAAMANCLEFDNYDLDLTGLSSIEELLNVLISIRNRSLIVIKDFDHWFEMHPNLKNEVFPLRHEDEVFPLRHENELTLSGLFEIIDGLVSCCWDEQIIVLTTSHNHRDRPLNLDAYMHTSSPRPIALPYGGEIVLLDSSEQKPLVDFDAANNMAYQGSVLVSNSEKENMRETSKRQCMTESVLSPDDSTTRISFTDFDAPDYRADLVRAYQSGPIMFTSENKDTRDGLYGECLTKSVLSDDDSTKQELLPEHTNLVFFSELTSEDINGFYDFVDSDSDDFDKFDDGAGMLPNVKDEFVDDLSSSCGDERITVSSTNQRDPHDAALLPLVNMDTDIHTASPQPIALPHSGEIVQLDSSEQKSLVDFDATNNSAYQSGVLLSSEKTNTIEACKGRWESLIQRTKKDMGEGLNGECLAKSILNLDDSTKRSSANTRRGRGCLPSIELEQPANNHHVGSAPSVNPSLWDRRHPCSGESPNAAGFHPGSLGKMRISNSPIHLDFVSQNMFPHVGGNCMDLSISSKNVGLHSPHLMFPGRGQISPVMSSFDSPNEWTRSRRNDGNSNQADSKKLYDLDIDRIGRGQDNRTTLVIKNIPNNFKHRYTSKMLLAAIDEGHRGTYDFVYLPIDFKNKCNVGYAFINMTDPSSIIPFYQAFNGKKWEKFNSEKVASLAYARIQGKAALVAHFQNSSLMNEDKRCRPILFNTDGPNAGDQVPFPMGVNVRSRPGKTRPIADEDNNQESPFSNGEDYFNGDL